MDTYSLAGFHEPLSSVTHLFAAPVFGVLGYFLVRKADGHTGRVVSLAIMAVCTVFLLSMSGVYHLLAPGESRQLLKRLDVAGVFALIAGTVTPVHAILFKGLHRWAPLVLIWTVAVVGITLRSVYKDQLPSAVGISVFLLMGWGGFASCALLWSRYGYRFIMPLFWGGIAYTLGAIIILLHEPTLIPGVVGPHELWHVAVLTGLGMHWKFVASFACGPPGL